MTTLNAAAATGLPQETFRAGWYRIWGNSINLAPAGSTHVVWIAEIPADPDYPMPRPWLGVWLTEADARFDRLSLIRGEVDLITGMIIERIETEAA